MSLRALAQPRRVLLDTSAYFILANRNDASHAATAALRDGLVAERWRMFTTNFVVAETHALILIRLGRWEASQFLAGVDQSTTTIVRVSLRDERRARDIIQQYDDKNFSLVDALSFAVMERLRIRTAFSFDRNFAQYGFQLLRA